MARNYAIAPSWRGLCKRPHSDLRWVTIIIGAIRINETDANNPEVVSDAVQRLIAGYRQGWLSLTRGRALPGLVWRGVMELELHHEVPTGSHRHSLLSDIGCDVAPLARGERILVVHTHLVASLGSVTEGDLRAALRTKWPGRWRTQVKGLFTHQTVHEAVRDLCSYCHKHRLQYSTGGLADEKVKFVVGYGLLWGRFINVLNSSFDEEFRSKR